MKKLYILLAFAIMFTSVQAQNVSVTFRVTLKGTGKKLHPDSLRVTGALGAVEQGDWSPPAALKLKRAANFATDSIYSVTLTIPRRAAPNDTFEYKFINGGDWGPGSVAGETEDERGVTAPCIRAGGGFGNRIWKMPATGTAFTLTTYKFNTCSAVFATGVNELSTASNMDIFPNPSTADVTLTFNNPNRTAHSLDIVNAMGQVVRTYVAGNDTQFVIERAALPAGIYFARMKNGLGESRTVRFVMN